MDALNSDSSILPKYMVPWKIIIIDDFPLTNNGKVDRKMLPLPNIDTI